MAKKKVGSNIDQVEFTNSAGIKVILTAMPPMLLQRIAGSVEYPKVPTYDISTVTGEVETYKHTADTLKTDEDKKTWAKYRGEVDEVENELTNRLLKAILSEATTLVDGDPDGFKKWITRNKVLGLFLPEDPTELEMVYKEDQVIRNKEDAEVVLREVMNLTGITEEVLQNVRNSFPDTMESSPPSK